MKTKILLLIGFLLIGINAHSQIFSKIWNELKETGFYVGFGFDPKMAYEGPGYSYTDKEHTFHWSAEVGFDQEHLRFSMIYEEHHEIDYAKWTYIKVDYKLQDFIFENLDAYAGLETSMIYRSGNIGWYWVDVEESNSFGVNVELKYNITERFSVGASYSVFTAEHALIEDDKFVRDEGMIIVYYKFL